MEQGAFIKKTDILDLLEELKREAYLQTEEPNQIITKEEAISALNTIHTIQTRVKKMTAFCAASADVQRRVNKRSADNSKQPEHPSRPVKTPEEYFRK